MKNFVEMACIIQIETSNKLCSLAVSIDGRIEFERQSSAASSHAANLGVYAFEAVEYIRKKGVKPDAVAVSAGPGSYTGLRIGVSEAKGLCYGLDIPLIAIPSLKVLCYSLKEYNRFQLDSFCFCPMIDARRMEVYAAIFDRNFCEIRSVQAEIIQENAYEEYLSKGKMVFFGDGADKCKSVINSPNALFIDDVYPLASAMAGCAEEAFSKHDFVDVAYFEPYYLKEFQATIPKNKVIF
jgi:tRNA threonylcarbamoyladenosine biosynthesis protein TsaB